MSLCRRLALVILGLVATAAQAAELGVEGSPLSLEVHAFVSEGFILTTKNNYLVPSTTRGSFEFAEAGINFTKPLTDRFRVGLQLFARKTGTLGDYSAKADWFYLDYHWQDWLGFRAGRVKLPFGLYNDSSDIDSARVPILLPQSIYPIQNRDFLLAQTGGELYGYVDLGASGGALDYHLYGGTIFLDVPSYVAGMPFQIFNVNTPYVFGGRLLWETPLQGFRFGGSVQDLRFDTQYYLTAPFNKYLTVQFPVLLWVASAEYSAHDLLVAAEYARYHADLSSDDPALFPAVSATNERGYLMVAYRVNSWLWPSLYYSIFFPNTDNRSGRENQQHDLAATLRFDVNEYWLVKVEGHYMNGTAALDSGINGHQPLSDLAKAWAVFLVKTSASF
jgi:hypothetical protein